MTQPQEANDGMGHAVNRRRVIDLAAWGTCIFTGILAILAFLTAGLWVGVATLAITVTLIAVFAIARLKVFSFWVREMLSWLLPVAVIVACFLLAWSSGESTPRDESTIDFKGAFPVFLAGTALIVVAALVRESVIAERANVEHWGLDRYTVGRYVLAGSGAMLAMAVCMLAFNLHHTSRGNTWDSSYTLAAISIIAVLASAALIASRYLTYLTLMIVLCVAVASCGVSAYLDGQGFIAVGDVLAGVAILALALVRTTSILTKVFSIVVMVAFAALCFTAFHVGLKWIAGGAFLMAFAAPIYCWTRPESGPPDRDFHRPWSLWAVIATTTLLLVASSTALIYAGVDFASGKVGAAVSLSGLGLGIMSGLATALVAGRATVPAQGSSSAQGEIT